MEIDLMQRVAGFEARSIHRAAGNLLHGAAKERDADGGSGRFHREAGQGFRRCPVSQGFPGRASSRSRTFHISSSDAFRQSVPFGK